jgi:hypothetical protein
MVVVSPFAREEADAATQTIRALWPGHVKMVRVAVAADASADAARNATSRPRVIWADSGATDTWTARGRVDTIGAVRAGDVVLVFPFVRRWHLAAARDTAGPDARVYARWADGEPAAVETMVNGGCIRSLAVSMPTVGDAILRPEFVRFTEALFASCGALHDFSPLPVALMTALEGGARLAPASSVKPRATRMTPLVPWLLAGALVLALLELLVRRGSSSAVGAEREAIDEARRAA